MNRKFFLDTLGWGFLLWLIGYLLGILLFPFASISLIGWIIMPIGIIIALWVLLKKIKSNSLPYFLKIAVIWTLVAVMFDYFFLVQLFKRLSLRAENILAQTG